MPEGPCASSTASYNGKKPTVCGEIALNLQLLRALLAPGQEVSAWRSPFLSVHPMQFKYLHQHGIRYDSSYAIGELRTAFPASTARHPYLANVWHDQPIWTLPIAQEDAMTSIVNGKLVRTELQASNRPMFLARWTGSLLRNQHNGAWNVMLLHPSNGVGLGPQNLAVKVAALGDFIRMAKKHDVLFERVGPLGDFWRGRDGVSLAVAWDPKLNAYVGTIQVGLQPTPRFSPQFGDNLPAFSCPGGGPVQLRDHRVVFEQPLPTGSKLPFTAQVAK